MMKRVPSPTVPWLFLRSKATFFLLSFLLSFLPGCAGLEERMERTPPVAPEGGFGDAALFGPRPDLPAPDDIHRLTPVQEAAFLAWFHDPVRSAVAPPFRLYAYLEQITHGFRYEGETLVAADTLVSRSGDCLSLAILTTALARLADVDISYQLMDDQPVYEFSESVVKKGVHVRTVLHPHVDAGGGSTPGKPGFGQTLIIDYFPSGRERFIANLDVSAYYALYYANLAAAALERGDLPQAFWHAMEALALERNPSGPLNLLAVINRRAGDAVKAEAIYRYAIARVEDRLTLLKNFQLLLQDSGRYTEAEAIGQELERLDDPSPFRWYHLARQSYERADYDGAIRYYTRALNRASYLHEAHLGLALAYYRQGRLRQAERALQQALDVAQRGSTRRLYEAKLTALRDDTRALR